MKKARASSWGALFLSCACSSEGSSFSVTARQAWPDRQAEPAPLTLEEWATACAIAGACSEPAAEEDPALARSRLTASCVDQPVSSEVAAVPLRPLGASPLPFRANERWSFYGRAVLDLGADCTSVRARLSPSPPRLRCRESGCDWFDGPPPLVRCLADVATLLTREGPYERDCSAAFARCDTGAVTGCSDRAPRSCEERGSMRCDGNVALGCDDEGLVTFADCALHAGGRCVEHGRSATCVYPDQGSCTASDRRCNGALMELCLQGSVVTVDCPKLGFAGCAETAAGPHCELAP